MDCVLESQGEIKACEQVLNALSTGAGLSALAQLVAVHIAAGRASTIEIARVTGYTARAIRKAKAELECRNSGAEAEPQCRNQGAAERNYSSASEPECRNPSSARNPGAGTPVPPQKEKSPHTPLKEKTTYLETTVENNNYPTPGGAPARESETDRLHREAFERGLALKGGKVAKSARVEMVATGELDGTNGIKFVDGKLEVFNGTAYELAKEFPSIDIAAVCNKAAPELRRFRNPTRGDALSVIRKWAQIERERRQTSRTDRQGRRSPTVSELQQALSEIELEFPQ